MGEVQRYISSSFWSDDWVDEHYIKLKRKANRKIFRSCSPDGKTIIANGQIHTLLANGDVKHDPIPEVGF